MTTTSTGKKASIQLLGLLAIILAALVVLAGYELQIPEVHVADAARRVFAWIAGALILIGGGYVVIVSIIRLRIATVIIGILAIMTALTIVGVTVGVPAILEPIVGLSNAIIGLLNLLISLLEKLVD